MLDVNATQKPVESGARPMPKKIDHRESRWYREGVAAAEAGTPLEECEYAPNSPEWYLFAAGHGAEPCCQFCGEPKTPCCQYLASGKQTI
ncbi:MAG: hypothetical protein ACRCTL_11050 [Pseudomonas sp.]